MPSIPISDGLSITADAQLAPWSALAQYAQDFPKLVASGADLARWQVVTLSDPAVQALDLGLALERPVSLANGAPAITLGSDAAVHFEVLTGAMFSPDLYGDNIPIPEGQCGVHLGITAGVSAGTAVPSGSVTFGLDAAAGIAIDTYRSFPNVAPAPTVLEALEQSLSELVIPFKPADTGTMPVGVVVTLGGSGSLKFSAGANLLALSNPMASLALPAPLPGLAVTEGASIKIGASWTIACEYQVRIHKLDANRVRLGWYRKHSTDFSVTASARAGVSAGTASEDLFPKIIGAISPDPKAGVNELKAAGSAAAAIEDTVKKAVSRKLEVAIAAELGSLHRDEAAFLYELDLGAMNEAARAALGQALHGDLSGFADPPAGVTEVRSILKQAQVSRFTFKVNLLGIFNFISVAKLALEGTVTWTPSTGELVIVDKATATRVQTAAVNFGAEEEKLRQVMAESFLITAAYRGTRTALLPPTIKSTHSFFRLDNDTSHEELNRARLALEAVGLNPQPLPPKEAGFGRTTVQVEANYDDAAALALFLDDTGKPRSVAEYEERGRSALALLVPPDGVDAYRLRPATNPALWKQMKDLGPSNFGQLFRGIEASVVAADYLAIRWWSDTMHSTAQLVEQVLRPGASDSAALREKLAKHLRDVADKAHAQFGTPWGLVAMFLVAGGAAIASGSITGPRFVFASTRPLVQGA